MAEAAAEKKSAGQMIRQYFLDFKVLGDNPREYWAVQAVNVLDLAAYFGTIAITMLYLTDTIMMDETNAGYTMAVFTGLITASLFISGFVTDTLGIRKSLLLSMVIMIVSRLGLVACGLGGDIPGKPWLVVALLALSAPGAAMTQTVYQAANRRFSTRRSRSASFTMWYLLMNLGGVMGGLMVDFVRKTLAVDITYVFAFAILTCVLATGVIFIWIRKEDQVVDPEDEAEAEETKDVPRKKSLQVLKEMVSESAFWRLIVLMVAVLGVRAAFVHMYMILPHYWKNIIENVTGEPTSQGLLQALNPVLIFLGLILVIPVANKFNIFKMLVFGAFISAGSLGIMILPWTWFGSDVPTAYFNMSVTMLVVLSVGEVFWSPKLSEYTAAIAPKGQEGSYLGLSMVPWFVAKMTVSLMSGHMIKKWVPEGTGQKIVAGELSFWDSPEAMWVILFVWALSGPIIALVFSKWLTAGADLDPSKATAGD